MIGNAYSQGFQPKRSFFSTVAWGASAVAVTLIASGSLIVVYGMNIVDRKTGNLIEFVEQVVQGLPELASSLPPVLADALNDERRPDYTRHLSVSGRMVSTRRGTVRPVITLENRGSEMVSMLSMRIVVLNEDGDPIAEVNEWGATPIAADDCWRGPLMPGSTRHFPVKRIYLRDDWSPEDLHVEIDITDVRVWQGERKAEVALTSG